MALRDCDRSQDERHEQDQGQKIGRARSDPFPAIEQTQNATFELTAIVPADGKGCVRRWPFPFACRQTEFGNQKQDAGVADLLDARANHRVIAAILSLRTELAAHVPDRRVKEQGSLHEPLEQTHQQIQATDVCHLMGHDDEQLFRFKLRLQPLGEQNYGTENPCDEGNRDPFAKRHYGNDLEPDPGGLRPDLISKSPRRNRSGAPTQPAHSPQAQP